MQVKKNKFLIGTLLSIASIGVVGSVTGTYAWYTYNAKDTVLYHGIAVSDSKNLEFRIVGTSDWKSAISSDELIKASEDAGHAGSNLKPISFTSDQVRNEELSSFYNAYAPYKTTAGNTGVDAKYLQVEIEFRCTNNPVSPTEAYAKDIYLSRLEVESTTEDKDISGALRMHFGTTEVVSKNTLIAPAKEENGVMNLFGKKDLDGKDGDDYGYLIPGKTDEYVEDPGKKNPQSQYLIYGEDNTTEEWYGTDETVATFEDGKLTDDSSKHVILTTSNQLTTYKSVVMTIWLDGWDDACVNANGGCEFDLNLVFQCEVDM